MPFSTTPVIVNAMCVRVCVCVCVWVCVCRCAWWAVHTAVSVRLTLTLVRSHTCHIATPTCWRQWRPMTRRLPSSRDWSSHRMRSPRYALSHTTTCTHTHMHICTYIPTHISAHVHKTRAVDLCNLFHILMCGARLERESVCVCVYT